MADPIVSDFRIETEQAIKNVNALARAYEQHNISLGAVVTQFGASRKAGDDLKTSFTQITAEGQKVTTVTKQVGDQMEVMSVKVGQATRAQQRLYQQMGQINKNITNSGLPLAETPTLGFSPTLAGANKALSAAQASGDAGAIAKAQADLNKLSVATQRGTIALKTMNLEYGNIQKGVKNLNQVHEAIGRLNQRAESFKATLTQIGAIGFATVIYRGISLITQGFTSSVGAAAEYYKQIGLIQTISQTSGESFDSWNKAIKGVADELGRPVTEVAEAAYDALSNQVIDTTRDFGLLTEAIRLGKNTASDTGTALNLLSSIINGFGKSTEQVRSITDSLFVTVDLGRVKLSELNETLGRSGALAKNVGVSLSEVEAGIALLTQTGIGSAEAVTLLNNIFVQLAKPNEALAAQLKKMNFETGKQAIETLRLSGLMQELDKASRNTADGLATFFPEIRGLRGASALTGTELQKFTKILDQVNNSAGKSKSATAILEKNLGQRFQDELAKIQNFFTVDIGDKFLAGVLKIGDAFGGLAKAVKEFSILALQSSIAIGLLVGGIKTVKLVGDFSQLVRGLVAVTLATGQATVAQGLLAGAIGKVGAVSLLIGGTAAAGYLVGSAAARYFETQAYATYNKLSEASDKYSKERVETERTANEKIIVEFDRSLEAQGRAFGDFIRELNKQTSKALEATKEAAAKTSEELKNTFEIFTGIIRKNISTLESEQTKALDAIKNANEEKLKFQEDAEQAFFERNVRRAKDRQQEIARNARLEATSYQQLATTLNQLVAQRNASLRQKQIKAIDDKDPALAASLGREIINNLETLASEKATINGITRDLFSQKDVEALIGQETRRTNDLLLSRTGAYQAAAGAAAKSALQEREQLKTAEDLFKKIREFSSTVVDGSNFKVKYADDPNKSLKDLDALQKKALEFLNTTGALNNPKTLESLGTSAKAITEDFKKQKEQLVDLINQTRLQISVNKASQTRTELASKETAAVGEATKKVNELNDALIKNQQLAKKQIEFFAQFARDKGNTRAAAQFGVAKDLLDKGGTAEERQRNNQQALSSIDAGINGLGIKSKTIRDAFDPNQFIPTTQALANIEREMGTINATAQQTDGLKAYREAVIGISRANLNDIGELSQKMLELEQIRFKFGRDDAGKSILPGLDETIQQLQRIKGLLDQINTLKASSKIPAGPASTGQAEPQAFGGIAGSKGGFLSDFLSGRYAKGGDLIPTMLQRGETVISEDMSKKYFRELTAIRQNRYPAARGASTSTTVGDINVNLGRGNSEVQARQLAIAMRRAARQGLLRG